MRTVALDFPKSILIETSNLCQGMCKFCPYQKIRKNQDVINLNINKFKELIDEISNYDIKRITLFNNNEPLMDDRIFDFIKIASEKLPNVEITLSTNGILLTLDKIIRLYDSGLTTLYVSIPTVDENNYKNIMGTNCNKLIKLLNSIEDKNLIKMIRIAVPITKYYNHEKMEKTLGKYLICEWDLEYKESWKIDESFDDVIESISYTGPCDRPMDQMVINSNGNVTICCRDWNFQNVVGNIYINSIYEIWHSNKMKEIQACISKQQYSDIDCCKDCNMNKYYYEKKKGK